MTRTIALVAPPGFQLMDVAGPMDVFAEANAQLDQRVYELEIVSTGRNAIVSSSGVELKARRSITDESSGKIHTLLVSGAPRLAELHPSAPLLEWLRRESRRARRFGSICSGAFLLAAAGLLEGRRVTTHWNVADKLARSYPGLTVEKDSLYIRDGRVRTAAGVTAGMDLALSLVEEDLGREVALNVSAQLVMFFKRPGGQLQFSRNGVAALGGRSALQDVQRWIAAHPAEDLSLPCLAARMELSVRHFSRLFHTEIGVTPADWVESSRIQAARTLLESATVSPKQVATQCGFSNVDVLRRAFHRHVGVTPSEYQKRFRSEDQPTDE